MNKLTLLGDMEKPTEAVAELKVTLCHRDESTTVRISARHLEDGVLVGRYERCGIKFDDDKISRVHLLVVTVGREVWAIDTASTNGVTRGEDFIFASRLRVSDELWLTEDVRVDWRLLSS